MAWTVVTRVTWRGRWHDCTARLTIWVNPLKASTGYEPLARGMAAALPFVDRFVEGHSAASLDELMSVIADCA
jgi:uncharacterized protein with von Willebrand factor type A (vWA) domain